MSYYDVEGVLLRMREACNAQNESQLARFLGIQSSTIVAWRGAKKPPYWACYELYEKTGCTVEWMITGEAPKTFPHEDENKVFNLSIEEFTDSFIQTIANGVHMGTLSIGDQASKEDLQRLATWYYNSVNNTILFPTKAKHSKKEEGKSEDIKKEDS